MHVCGHHVDKVIVICTRFLKCEWGLAPVGPNYKQMTSEWPFKFVS